MEKIQLKTALVSVLILSFAGFLFAAAANRTVSGLVGSQAQSYKLRPQVVSSQANNRQLVIGENQGRAYAQASREAMRQNAPASEKVAGDYIVGYVADKAGGFYSWRENKLVWVDPGDANAHIEITVRDAAGRFLPYMNVYTTLIDAGGKEIGTAKQDFIWHPWFFHYARNWKIPASGIYTIRVKADPPRFDRHDEINGRRYDQPLSVEFPNVRISTGKK